MTFRLAMAATSLVLIEMLAYTKAIDYPSGYSSRAARASDPMAMSLPAAAAVATFVSTVCFAVTTRSPCESV